jgi:hypothetical protein
MPRLYTRVLERWRRWLFHTPPTIIPFVCWFIGWHLLGCYREGLRPGYKDSIILSWRFFTAEAQYKMGNTYTLNSMLDDLVSPNKGGCWFCSRKDSREMVFSHEFDCYLHTECLKKAIGKSFGEAEIMARELGIDHVENIS